MTETEKEVTRADVLVIGSGLAAGIAALAAARQHEDAAVQLLRPKPERLRRHTGTVDVLGYLPPESDGNIEDGDGGGMSNGAPIAAEGWAGPVRQPFSAMQTLDRTHPYRRLGPETVREALGLFDDVMDYRGKNSERNALVATHAGRIRPAARYPPAMESGLLSRRDPIRLVGFAQLPDFDAAFIAERLDATLPYDVRASTIEFPGTITEFPPGLDLARALDEDEQPAGDVGMPTFGEKGELPDELIESGESEPLREPLLDRLEAELDVEPRLGFPAILGDREAATIRETFEHRLGVDVFEVPISPPSVPGTRLARDLQATLVEADVSIADGDVNEFEEDEKQIGRVTTEETSYDVEAVVLATGGLETTGLVADRREVHEPRFGCPVDAPTDRLEWTEPDPLAPHPFTRFGVAVDDELRPVDGPNEPIYDNLHTVGSLIGGFDFVAEQSTDGVALTTGFAAGKWAI